MAVINTGWTVCVAAALLALGLAPDVRAATLGVEIANRSEEQLCAEKDNVSLMFTNPAVRHFRVEASHPLYVDMINKDTTAPDWTACPDIAPDPNAPAPAPPHKTTIYEDLDVSVVGFSYPGFWRTNEVPIRVGGRTQSGFQYIQVWLRAGERSEEVLVLYPSDGYWRARPFSPPNLSWSAYGSSFLIGPIEDISAPSGGTRPAVDIRLVDFEPKTRTFTLSFVRGGHATVTIAKIDREREYVDVTFDTPVSGLPFAGLRSMYVTRFNNDVADVAVLEAGAKSWREQPVMAFSGAKAATSLWAGRIAPSRHNTSSPDMILSGFTDAAPPASAPVKR